MQLRNLLAPLALVLAFAVQASAQCITPDNLDAPGGGCQPGQTSVPQQGFTQKSLGICWRDCSIDASQTYAATWGPLVPVTSSSTAGLVPSCGWYRARLQLVNSSGLAWIGTMNLSYSRTWAESPTAGQVVQVWRYLVNGDLTPTAPTSMPCGTPACAAPNGNRVRFTGYVDYANKCGTTITQRAWMLTHACDAIDHAPGFPRAGTFHPNRYYTFVGPALGFVIGAGSTLEAGGAGVECLRRWDASALPARCALEEPLITAAITANTMTCMCGTGPSNWYQGQLFAAGGSGSVVNTFAGADPFRSFPVGKWTVAAIYPGPEEVRWNCNEAQFIDCTGVGRNEYYYGVTTAGGWAPYSINTSSPSMPLPTTFVDQSNSVVLPANFATRNVQFRSDHILNLNF
jgi:hypothetical protein